MIITNSENQRRQKTLNISLTTIDLGECETKLKQEYNISKNKSLYIFKVDILQDGLKIPKIEYEVYYPLHGKNLIKLNLTICQGVKMEFLIPVNINQEMDQINVSSGYYNDICYTYTSKEGTDISLKDRIKQFVDNNLTVC